MNLSPAAQKALERLKLRYSQSPRGSYAIDDAFMGMRVEDETLAELCNAGLIKNYELGTNIAGGTVCVDETKL